MKSLTTLKQTYILTSHAKENKSDYSTALEHSREFKLRYSVESDYSFLLSAISKNHNKVQNTVEQDGSYPTELV